MNDRFEHVAPWVGVMRNAVLTFTDEVGSDGNNKTQWQYHICSFNFGNNIYHDDGIAFFLCTGVVNASVLRLAYGIFIHFIFKLDMELCRKQSKFARKTTKHSLPILWIQSWSRKRFEVRSDFECKTYY